MPVIALQRGTLVRLPGGRGTTVTACAGAVWITEHDSPRDVVLTTGQSFKLARPGLALVQAFRDASISVDGAQAVSGVAASRLDASPLVNGSRS